MGGGTGALKDHLNSDKGCGYVEVECTNQVICKEIVKRSNLQVHIQYECMHRSYKCQHCGFEDTYFAINQYHYTLCPKFPIECPNKCGVGDIERKALDDHRSSCLLEPVVCPFDPQQCKTTVSRKDIESHKQICDYRPYTCEHCGLSGIHHVICTHYAECPDYPLLCPNNCSLEVKRKEISSHRGICPLERVDCPFKDVDCTEKVARENMQDHTETSTHQHMLQMLRSHQELARQNEEFSRKNQELARIMKNLASSVKTSIQELTCSNEQLVNTNKEFN